MMAGIVFIISLLTASLCFGYVGEWAYEAIRRRKNAREIRAEMQMDHARAERIIALREIQRQEAERQQNPFLRDVYARKD